MIPRSHRCCGSSVSIRLSLFLIWAFLPCASFALQPARNYSDKSVADLLLLLEDKDPTARHCAAIFIGDRYRDPKSRIGNAPIHKPNSPSPEFPIPDKVIPALAEHLKSDQAWDVRVCAINALYDLRFHTNTTSLIALALDDIDPVIRIRACTALVNISHKYKEPLQSHVVETLEGCLNPAGAVEVIWQAAFASEALGRDGRPLIPALEALATHNSDKVREYANRALKRIRSGNKN